MEELKNKKILIVDDEKEILTMLKEVLTKEGFYHIFTAQNCETALKTAKENYIGLFVLDVNLPDGNGFYLYQQLRQYSKAPVLFLTARGEAEDKIQGLVLGADDYIVKPFLIKELVLRMTAVLRRTYHISESNDIFELCDRKINFETASVVLENKEISLTAKEFVLLKKLCENKNKIVTSDALCISAWGEEYYGYENTLMVHIRRLREKIEQNPSKPKHLITVKGIGYKLVVHDE